MIAILAAGVGTIVLAIAVLVTGFYLVDKKFHEEEAKAEITAKERSR